MYQYWLNCNKCTTLEQDVNVGETVGEGVMWELSVLSDQFFHKPKTALKIKCIPICISSFPSGT